jgi:antitoxin YefM
MKAVTYDFAKHHFEEIVHMAEVQNDGVIIVKEDKNYVLMDRDFLDSVIETVELAKDEDFVSSLKMAKEEIERGETFTFEDVF